MRSFHNSRALQTPVESRDYGIPCTLYYSKITPQRQAEHTHTFLITVDDGGGGGVKIAKILIT